MYYFKSAFKRLLILTIATKGDFLINKVRAQDQRLLFRFKESRSGPNAEDYAQHGSTRKQVARTLRAASDNELLDPSFTSLDERSSFPTLAPSGQNLLDRTYSFPSDNSFSFPTYFPSHWSSSFPTYAPSNSHDEKSSFPTSDSMDYSLSFPTFAPSNSNSDESSFTPTSYDLDLSFSFPTYAPSVIPSHDIKDLSSSFPTFAPSNSFLDDTSFPTYDPKDLSFSFPTNAPSNAPMYVFPTHDNDLSISIPTFVPTSHSLHNVSNDGMKRSCFGDTAFQPISLGQTGVSQLTLGDDEVQQITLPFDFNWLGLKLIPAGTLIGVSSNGQINIDPDDFSNACCSPLPVGPSYHLGPRIAFCQEDLNPGAGGNVLIRALPSSLLVSFQAVPWFLSNYSINVQTEIFPDGRVSVCFGDGNNDGNSCAVGLEDGKFSIPATDMDFGFNNEGITDQFPEGYCYCFIPDGNLTVSPTISPSPSAVPSSSPTSFPTTKSFQGSCFGGSGFQEISETESGVVRLEMMDDEVQQVTLPFDFYWMGRELIPARNTIGITSNGQINISPDNLDSGCCSARPLDGSYSLPRIAFCQEDLNPAAGGDVLVRCLPSSLLVSFQNVPWFGSGEVVNAQTEIFPDGRVSICFGDGKIAGNSLAVGLEDGEHSFPANDTHVGFNAQGITSRWPRGYCYCFAPEGSV